MKGTDSNFSQHCWLSWYHKVFICTTIQSMYSRDNRTKEKFNLCLVSTGCCSLSSWVTLAITLPGFQYCSFFIREMITLRIKQILFWSWPVPTGIFPNFFPIFVCSIGIILDSMHPSIKQKTWAGYWCEMG